MLDLQHFKHYVTETVFNDVNCLGTYHPSLYVYSTVGQYPDGRARFQATRIPWAETELMNQHQFTVTPRLREVAIDQRAFLTCLVYRRWAISFTHADGSPWMHYLDNPVVPGGGWHPYIENLRQQEIQYKVFSVLLAVYEYPTAIVGRQPHAVYDNGCTLESFFLENTTRLPGLRIAAEQCIGTEYGHTMDTMLFGREILPGILHENGPHANLTTPNFYTDDMTALIAGSPLRL